MANEHKEEFLEDEDNFGEDILIDESLDNLVDEENNVVIVQEDDISVADECDFSISAVPIDVIFKDEATIKRLVIDISETIEVVIEEQTSEQPKNYSCSICQKIYKREYYKNAHETQCKVTMVEKQARTKWKQDVKVNAITLQAFQSVVEDKVFQVVKSDVTLIAEKITKFIQKNETHAAVNKFEKLVLQVLEQIPEGNTSRELETLMNKFHKISLSTDNWDTFIGLVLATDGTIHLTEKENDLTLLFQSMQDRLLTELLHQRNRSLSDTTESISEDDLKLSPNEQNTIRYIAGYIPFSLLKALEKREDSPGKNALILVLHSWNKEQNSKVLTFLEFTRKWMESVNRGGLFEVSDDFFIFVRRLEIVARKLLNRSLLITYTGEDLRNILLSRFEKNKLVQQYWDSLTTHLQNQDLSHQLKLLVLKKWINIRVNAFVKAWIDIAKLKYHNKKKRSKEKNSKEKSAISSKGQPALRKTLAS